MKPSHIIAAFNVLGGIALALLGLTMLGRKEYAHIVFEGPIYFGDVAIVAMFVGVPIVLAIAAHQQGQRIVESPSMAIVFVLGLLSGAVAYYSLPSVREERIFREFSSVNTAIERLVENRDSYIGHEAYYRHRLKELTTFRAMFESQSDYLSSAMRVGDKRANRISMFFGVLSLLLVVNVVLRWLKWPG